MLQPTSHAWHLVSQGDLSAAERIFQNHLNQRQDSIEALRGLARVALHRGQYKEAEQLARRGLSIDETADLQLLMGEILGAQGRRREAEQYLAHAVTFHSSDSYARSLLGEQKIRQGRWEEGTDDFIEAMSDDVDGDAFRHAQKVISDLIDAYVAGRIPEQEAMKFINRLDYSVPKSGPEMQSFFATARRCVNSRQSLSIRHDAQKTLPASIRRQAQAAQQGAQSAQQGAQSAQQGAQSAQQGLGGGRSGVPPRREPPPRASNSQAAARRSQARKQRPSSKSRAPRNAPDSSASSKRRIDAKQQDLQALIRHERSLNRDLLSDLPEMGPPEWPSMASNAIDNVAAISLDRGSVLGESIGIDTWDFRLTSGDILAEIFLERCLRQLLVASQKNKSTPIVLRPESIWQMELNCRDGLLDDLGPLSPLYKDQPGFEDFRALALGFFLGECLIQAYDGTWSFETAASQSYLEIGTNILEPFKVAARWIAAQDKDEVHLTALATQAKRASEKSTSLTIASDYIDPTKELTKGALAAKLAELWSFYRFKLPDTVFSRVAETVELISVGDDAILFEMGAQWAPQFARGPQDSALLDGDKVAMAYLRERGDFVPLASREGFARLMDATSDTLDKASAGRALGWLASYHRPGWWVASSDAEAARLSERVGTSLDSPQIEHGRSGATLVVDVVSSDGPLRWNLTFDPSALTAWELEIQG